ncbi:hypothetical protein ABZV51_15945, partial [Streptomyces avermitilis]
MNVWQDFEDSAPDGEADALITPPTAEIPDRVKLGSVFKDHRMVDHDGVIRRHELTDQEWKLLAP